MAIFGRAAELASFDAERFRPTVLFESGAMKVVLARPGEEKLSLPGCALARSITSFTVFAGTFGLAIR